jgi:hypothetical protein
LASELASELGHPQIGKDPVGALTNNVGDVITSCWHVTTLLWIILCPLLVLLLPPQALGAGTKCFVLKNLAYDSVHRADLFMLPCPASHLEAYLARPDIIITPQQPWILQEFIRVGAILMGLLLWPSTGSSTNGLHGCAAAPHKMNPFSWRSSP